MANIKFSAFTQKVVQTNVDFLVGYTGADNVRITPTALGDGIYLPLGGGTMTGNVIFNDNVSALFGTSSDMTIKHDGSNSKIENNTGDLYIINEANDEDIIFQCDDGAGGVETYFYLDGSNATGAPQTIFPENCYLNFGNNSDLKILHAGGNSTMQNDTGDWYMRQTANDKDIIILCDDGAGGHTPYITLDGSAAQTQVDMDFSFTDNVKAKFGSSGDLEIYHDASNSYISDQGTGRLIIKTNYLEIDNAAGNEAMIEGIENGAVKLYYDSAQKLETTATGIEVTDEVSIGTSLVHTGDTDTKVSFGTDEIVLTTAGTDAVTVDSSQNATFAGAGTFGGQLKVSYLNPVFDLQQSGATKFRMELDGADDTYITGYGTGNKIFLRTDGTTALTLDGSQNATFAGDIEVENSANGLILESPDGTRYRVTVANGGTLSVAAV